MAKAPSGLPGTYGKIIDPYRRGWDKAYNLLNVNGLGKKMLNKDYYRGFFNYVRSYIDSSKKE
jgi:hypothetical protein